MRNIALIAKRGTGKTTCRRILETQGYQDMSWADPVRELAAMAYDDRFQGTPEEYGAAKVTLYDVRLEHGRSQKSGTWILQHIGTEALRLQVDLDFWVKAGLRRLAGRSGPFVNDDTRFPNEVAALREAGWLIVGITCSEGERVRRLTRRDGMFDPSVEGHASETSISLADADVVLDTSNNDYGILTVRLQGLAQGDVIAS